MLEINCILAYYVAHHILITYAYMSKPFVTFTINNNNFFFLILYYTISIFSFTLLYSKSLSKNQLCPLTNFIPNLNLNNILIILFNRIYICPRYKKSINSISRLIRHINICISQIS